MSRKNRSRTQQAPKGRAPKRADVTTATPNIVDTEAAETSEGSDVEVTEIEVADVEVGEVEVSEVEVSDIEVAEIEVAGIDDAVEESATDAPLAEADAEIADGDITAFEVTEILDVTEEATDDRTTADNEALGVVDDAAVARANAASYDHLKPIIEALIFASPEPLTPKTLFKLLESEPKEDVETALALLRQDYDHPGGLQLVEVAGGYQIVTRPELHEYVRRLFHERTSSKLSVQALETLAVIAYKQPITAPEITEIRGVNTSGVLNTLIDRKLVKIVGRKNVVGRPFMYATTRDFLDKFGLNDLTDLPKVEDLADVLGFEPPSLDANEPSAEALAFDFGDPEESGRAQDAMEQDAPVDAPGDADDREDDDVVVALDEIDGIGGADVVDDSVDEPVADADFDESVAADAHEEQSSDTTRKESADEDEII